MRIGAAGVGQHEGEALGWIVGVERQVGGAGFEDTEERDHHVERALDAEAEVVSGPAPRARRWCASWFARMSSSR